jgi:hypothetical protein
MGRTQDHTIIAMANDDQGFTIVCHDGEEVYVAADEAAKLIERCDFFANVFRHDMLESKARRITKPDWTVRTAQGFVELVTKEKAKSDSAIECLDLIDACEQMLFPVEILPSSAVATDSQVMDKESVVKLCKVATRNPFEWELLTTNSRLSSNTLRLSSETFHRLLQHNITVSTEEDFRLRTIKECATQPCMMARRQRGLSFLLSDLSLLGSKLEPWHIRCDSLEFHSCFYDVYKSLCRENPAKEGHRIWDREQFCLRVPMFIGFNSSLIDGICRKTGASGYIHQKSSIGFYLDGSFYGFCPTFTGSFKQLKDTLDRCLGIYWTSFSTECKRCSLRIKAPTSDTTVRLIDACRHCADNPNSLGADFRVNALYAIKTVNDMKILLSHLVSDGSKAVLGSFKLVELTQPTGVF